MQFHASKIVSALILLNTTICLAMKRGSGYDPYKIGIASATCENRVYDGRRISLAMKGGMRSISLMEEANKDLDVVRYKSQPTEVMPSDEKFYLNGIQSLGPNEPLDYVVFSRSGLLAKVVSRVPDSQGFKYIDCVTSPTTPSPQELQTIWRIPGQSSRRHGRFGIGITSVSCEGRVYNRRKIYEAIKYGMDTIARFKQTQMNPDVLRYNPKPTEVMPLSEDMFYFSELKKLTPYDPVDFVIFSRSGQFAKTVILKKNSGEPDYVDCVSSSYRQFPERSRSRIVSTERLQPKIGSPEPPQPRMGSSKEVPLTGILFS